MLCVYCVCISFLCVCVRARVVAPPLWVAPALEGKVDKRLGAASAAVLTKWVSWSPGPVAAAAAAAVVRRCVDDVEK